MSPSATLQSADSNGQEIPSVAPSKAAPTPEDLSVLSDAFQHFDSSEMARLRALAPALDYGAIIHVNSGYQALLNLRVKAALDQFLLEGACDPNPKGKWQQNAAQAAKDLARYLNVDATSLAWTRDTTEGLNLFQRSIKFNQGDNVVLLEGEHPNHVYGWLALRELGLEVRTVPDAQLKIIVADADTFQPYVDDRTVAIGISSVMFHSGQLNDVKDIASRFRPQGIHVLVDATQHVGAAPIDLRDWNVSAAAFGTHKALSCPTGLGALYINPDVLCELKTTPPLVGAGAVSNIQSDLIARPDVEYHNSVARYSHLNFSLISATALRASLELLQDDIGMARLESHLRALGRELIRRLDALNVGVVGSRIAKQRAPHIYIVELLHADWVTHFLEDNVIVTPYRMGVRVSFGFYNSLDDVVRFAASVERGLTKGIQRTA